ncbi:MAG TPA: peptidase domain-containing ABC transporter [Longimicrobiales bacterium]|nr:peptidase domain-containing ABC transporter [Longimicrobiales bacterium]
MRKRFPRVRQRDGSDCGAACLAAVAAYHGARIPIARIRQLAGTDRSGTSALGLVEAAGRLGLSGKAVRGGPDSLARVPKPCIAHTTSGPGRTHFVVVCEASERSITVMDPAQGRLRTTPLDGFVERWTGILVLLLPAPDLVRRDEVRSTPARFLDLLRPHGAVVAAALAGALAYTILGLSTAVFVQKLVDYVLVDGNTEALNVMGAAMLALLAAQAFIGWVKGRLTIDTGQRIDARLVLGYYRHLLALPQRFFDTMRVGEVVSRVNDAVKIRAFINDVALDLAVNTLVLVCSLGLMVAYSTRLAALAAATVPLHALVYALANRRNRRGQRALMERAAELESHLVESIGGAGTLRACTAEALAATATEARVVRVLRAAQGSATTSLAAATASQSVSRLCTVGVLWAGARLVLRAELTPGELMSCYALLGYLSGPVLALVSANRVLQDAFIAADRLFEILELDAEERSGLSLTPDLVGDVRLRGVAFRYGTRPRVFDGLDLTLARGAITAIVGESGCGKSTLAALLLRAYPPEAGTVEINGYDVRHVSTANLRRIVGIVPQRVELFAGDVVHNIALGDFEPDLRRVLDVCRSLGLDELIERLPAGLRTPLGEGGSLLSGGERQRIAIARALYRDPEILVLDEATSALDSHSERIVQEVLLRLREQGKTVVVIAHRLSTVARADRIVVIEAGKAAEEGTHRELLAAGGAYARLWLAQYPDWPAAADTESVAGEGPCLPPPARPASR